MKIETVKEICEIPDFLDINEYIDGTAELDYFVTGYLLNNKIEVPIDDSNSLYRLIIKWVESGNTVEKCLSEEEQLDIYKRYRINEVEKEYSKRSYDNIVFNDITFQADKHSQDLINKVISGAPDGFVTIWLDAFNKPHNITIDELKQLAMNILIRSEKLFKVKSTLKQQIYMSTSLIDIANIDIYDAFDNYDNQ